jgi:purine-binding chemotaxis protein CheW
MTEEIIEENELLEKSKTEEIKNKEIQIILFNLDKECYGIDIDRVRYIIKYPVITTVPNSKSFIHGVLNLRGKIIVVVDLSKRIGLSDSKITNETRIIITEIENDWIGFLVDSVSEVIKITNEKILPTPNNKECDIKQDYIQGVVPFNQDLLIIFNIDKLFKPEELGINKNIS